MIDAHQTKEYARILLSILTSSAISDKYNSVTLKQSAFDTFHRLMYKTSQLKLHLSFALHEQADWLGFNLYIHMNKDCYFDFILEHIDSQKTYHITVTGEQDFFPRSVDKPYEALQQTYEISSNLYHENKILSYAVSSMISEDRQSSLYIYDILKNIYAESKEDLIDRSNYIDIKHM